MDNKNPLSLNLYDNNSKETKAENTSEDIQGTSTQETQTHSAQASSMPDISLENLETQSTKKSTKNTHEDSSAQGRSESVTKNTDNLLTVTLLQELVRLLQPKPFRKRHPIIFWGSLILLGLFLYGIFDADESPIASNNRIAVVRIEGSISKVEPLLKWIAKIEKTQSVKGVLLRIDSPGGGVGASQELYSALQELGKTKPVVASMGSTAASGGLMVAMAAHHIVAYPSTITGSIGVRMDIPQVYKLLESIGIGQETLTTGKFKDATSMMRALTPENRAYLQGVLENLYEQFVDRIVQSRKRPLEAVKKIAEGRIFTGREAKKLGLVDSLGGQNVALKELQKLTGVKEDTPLYEQPKDLEEFYEDLLQNIVRLSLDAQRSQQEFLYQ